MANVNDQGPRRPAALPYTGHMRCAVAQAVSQEQREQLAAMTPAERVALVVVRLSEEGLASYMATHGLDRQTAITRIRATRRVGRRPSASADADDD